MSMSKKYIGLFSGILSFVIILLLPEPEGLSAQGKHAAAVVVLMSIWWITEAIPVYVTAFVPLVLYPPLRVLGPAETAANYGHNYALMFLAVFFLAKAIEVQNLHKRIALSIINIFGTSRQRIVLSMMIATAAVSMWIANVTTALMMLPIAMAIIAKDEAHQNEKKNGFAPALMLGIAYSASIGGLATLIGSPTTMIFVGIFDKMFPEAPPVTFFTWLKIGLPIVVVFIPIFWFFIIRYFQVKGLLSNNLTIIKEELQALGRMSTGEYRVVYVCLFTVLGWIFKDDLVINNFILPGWVSLTGMEGNVHDSTIAMAGALILFSLPDGKGKKLITWKEASQVPWGVVMIVGGGYAVASGFVSTGLADWLGVQLTFINTLPFFFVLIIVLAFVLMFTEFNSNTASANILLPMLASMALAAKVNPLIIMIPAAIACSCAFMMPAATGPNTVVLASERISVSQMVRCGFWLNLITLVLLTVLLYFVILPWLGIEMALPVWATH
jgi:sodium-dependent dicarboxylate transporter 2/3/5